jgi:glycerate dehydrogenase
MRLAIVGDLEPTDEQVERMRELGLEVTMWPRGSDPDAVDNDLRGSAFAFFNNVDVNPWLDACAALRLGVLAFTGYQMIDVEEARRLGVKFAYLPSYSTQAVVEYVIGAVLTGLRSSERELGEKRVGIVGYGRIGKGVGRAVAALGADVAATTRTPRDLDGARWAPLMELARESDVLVVSCALADDSRGLLDQEVLASLPDDVVIASVVPNDVFDLDALGEALSQRPAAQACLDLDPLPPDHQLFSLSNVQITPHIAFKTGETITRRIDQCIDEVEAVLSDREPTLLPPLVSG